MQLNIFEDESIHSYFIRILMCVGDLNSHVDLQGLVSASGSLGILPKLEKQKSSLFNHIPNSFFRTLLIKHSVFKELRYFDLDEIRNYIIFGQYPVDYGDGLHKIYNGKTQLRYCPKCFESQIRDNGVSWFRLNWLCSVDCEIHSTGLYHVLLHKTNCCRRSSNILRDLHSAMSGICSFCAKSSWIGLERIFISDRNRGQYIIFKPNTEARLSKFNS